MWIIPKQSDICPFVQDTKGLGVDLEEFTEMSERSLMWRSKPSQSQTWSRRWKRVTYIQRLSTRILKHSHTKSFLDAWTSSLRDSHVSHSHLRDVELPQTILDTFTPTSQEESQNADQLMLFSKTSKGLSQAKQGMGSRYSNMSSETWKKEVIEHRGEYSQRAKLGLHINGRESLSWPTATTSDGEGGRQQVILDEGGFKSKRKTSGQIRGAKLRDAVENYENWPTADATNIGDGVPWEVSKRQLAERRARVKKAVKEGKTKAGSGRSANLAMAVQREKAREEKWSTPTTQDTIEHPNMVLNERGRRLTKDGKDSHSVGLGDQVKININEEEKWTESNKLLRTFSTEDTRKPWQTPTTRDWKDTGNIKNWKSLENHQMSLPKQVGLQDPAENNTSGKSQGSWGTSCLYEYNKRPFAEIDSKQASLARSLGKNNIDGRLNPNWVEQLMGLPVGWTQLPTEWID